MAQPFAAPDRRSRAALEYLLFYDSSSPFLIVFRIASAAGDQHVSQGGKHGLKKMQRVRE